MFWTRFLLLLLSSCSVRGGRSERKTQYGCEGSDLQITCPSSTLIKLVRANFGRFSISICNDLGNTEWSVNCMEPRTLRVIKARCDDRNECRIPVNATLFGDPCPGTHKYVEVHYTCQNVNPSSNKKIAIKADNNENDEKMENKYQNSDNKSQRKLPPWLYELGATPPAIDDVTERIDADQSFKTSKDFDQDIITPINEDEDFKDFKNKEEERDEFGFDSEQILTNDEMDLSDFESKLSSESPLTSSSSTSSLSLASHCPPRSSRFLFWNYTSSDSEAIQLCPPGTSGFARWHCGSDAKWRGKQPDLSECQSLWLSRLDARLQSPITNEDETTLSVASEMALGSSSKTLYGGDLLQVASVIRGLTHRLRRTLYTKSSIEEQTEAVQHIWSKIVLTVSNLLAKNDNFEDNLGDSNDFLNSEIMSEDEYLSRGVRRSKMLSASLGVMEALQNECSRLLARTIKKEARIQALEPNLDAFVRVLKARQLSDQLFRSKAGDQIVVPARGLLQAGASVNGAVRINAFFYRGIENRLRSGSKHFFVNSNILALSLANNEDEMEENLDEGLEVFFTVKHLRTENVRTPVCVAFDKVEWNSDQCVLLASNKTHTVCKCHVVAIYGVLMQNHYSDDAFISEQQQQTELGETMMVEETTLNTLEQSNSSNTTTTWILLLLAVVMSVIIVSTLLVLVKRLELRARVRKLVHKSNVENADTVENAGALANGNNTNTMAGVFRCKKPQEESTVFYPALTSSPTSTTVSNGNVTPNSTNPYLEQMLEQYEPRVMRTGPNGRPMVALNQCDPFGHHIYMEIDPIYAALERHGTDMMPENARNQLESARKYQIFPSGEERPLIRHNNNVQNAWHVGHVDAAPLSIAMQGNDHFVSLRLNENRQHQHQLLMHQHRHQPMHNVHSLRR